VCDGTTNNITLRVAGLTSYSTSCNATTGAYSIGNVAYSPGDMFVVYIDGETEKGATVSEDPISSVANMHIYEQRVIARHEGTDPLSIADMSVWDSADDGDIPYTAVTGSPDTLTLPANRKLIVWNSKEFEPVGNVTITGNGGGAAHDGTLELFSGSLFTGGNGESHTIGGSLVSGSGATFDSADSTFTFTANGSGKTIDTNDSDFYNLTMNGSGTWNVNDAILTVSNDLTISSGTLTLPTATTTIGGGLSVTSGSFNANNGIVVFTSGSSENIQAGNSAFAQLRINGSGSFTMLGTNATATRDVLIKSGSLTSVSGTFTIGKEFIVDDTFVHNAGTLRFTATSSVRITASSSDLGTVRTAGVGTYTFTDHDVALLGSLIIQSGTVNLATGTMAIGGSLNNTGGSFTHASGTILFNSTDTGETVQTSGSVFHAIMFGSATGGWTIIENATSTSHVTLSTASSFTLASSTTLTVQGVFTNLVGGAQTTWTGSTLRILSGVPYTINSKTVGGDTYNKVLVGSSTALRMWDSSAAVTILDSQSSLYAQDYGGVAGALNIYGNYSRSTGADYWSYATDFDGTALGGSSRQVTVYHAAGATTTLSGGSLNIVGAGGNDTTITNQGTGTYTLRVLAGTFNALYYAFSNLGASGLVLSGTPTITSLSEGNFTLAVNNGSLITLASTTLNHNAGLVSSNNSFATTSAITGKNITLVGTTPSSWYFTNHTGNLDGESFDVDGGDACGSVRWSDSSCLLTQQSAYRFRHDDGGEGVPNSEWYDQNWSKRKRVNITNSDPTTYSNTAIKVPVTYDSDMQSDFDDLRFTASDGVTSLDYYIETFSASTNAVAWVRIPSLTANTKTEIYMYYGNGAAIDSSTSTTFSMIENFEDGSMSGYAGDGTGEFSVTTSGNVHERAYSLKASDPNNGRTQNGGVYNSGYAVAQGQKLRYFAYVDTTSGSGDEMCTLFGTQGNDSQNYAVCLELYGTDRISLVENALDNDTSGTILSSTTVSYSTGWYEVEVAWGTDDSIFVTLMKDGSVVATTSANDGTYTSGGIGYSLWFYHGAWDMYTARPLLTNEPSVSFGFEQVSGGASWKSARNTPATGVQVNDVVRVRFLVENTGLAVNNQNYEIEYAPKGNAPSCEAVNYNTYVEIPNQASCGTSDLCMQSTTYISNLASTTDILGGLGTYTYGQFVENASNNSGNISVPNNYYTELEYALTPTANVTDSNFCLRVTNEGTELDSYTHVAELELIFAPTITALSLNGGNDIVLTGGATTTVYATGTVSDLNGYDDIEGATTTIFRSGVGESCGANNNNCYVAGNSQCGMQNCSGYTCEVSCSIDMYYHADPTDIGTFAAETWRALLRVNDAGGSVATATAPSIDLLTLRAIAVDSSINYGSLAVNDDTGSYNATTSVQNIGNDSLDIAIEGTDLTDGGSSSIPVNEQKFATSTFTYASCVYCSQLATTTTNIKMDLSKPAATTPAVIDQLFWGIAVPLGVAGTVHQGANTFYAIGDLP
ncbi:MAG TPA: DUF2341 domain-containing protein, partial [Candidatus Paceibacterota bacterium]|nr:DUF2341 domain-containing protein [Candidatus Paceibacterota bacterium]